MDLKKQGTKKHGHYYSKREEAAWPDHKKISGQPDKLE